MIWAISRTLTTPLFQRYDVCRMNRLINGDKMSLEVELMKRRYTIAVIVGTLVGFFCLVVHATMPSLFNDAGHYIPDELFLTPANAEAVALRHKAFFLRSCLMGLDNGLMYILPAIFICCVYAKLGELSKKRIWLRCFLKSIRVTGLCAGTVILFLAMLSHDGSRSLEIQMLESYESLLFLLCASLLTGVIPAFWLLILFLCGLLEVKKARRTRLDKVTAGCVPLGSDSPKVILSMNEKNSTENMTSDGTNSYAWDAENRMIKITLSNVKLN